MSLKTVRVYRCRNCGREIIEEKDLYFSLEKEEISDFVNKANSDMSESAGECAFFHACNRLQAGCCVLIRREIEPKELERQKSLLKAELKDIEKLA